MVHDALVSAIVTERLKSGELYSVKELAEQFGVSRTPVREAMLQLARRGMVDIVRNQGVREYSSCLAGLGVDLRTPTLDRSPGNEDGRRVAVR